MKRVVWQLPAVLLSGLVLTACVTSTVDEMVFNEPTEGIGDASVVILGRRHASDYETEPDFINCVGKLPYLYVIQFAIHQRIDQVFLSCSAVTRIIFHDTYSDNCSRSCLLALCK